MEIWLLLTAYRKSPAPYPMAPSPTLYDLPFSHNASVMDGRHADDGRQPCQYLDRCSSTIG